MVRANTVLTLLLLWVASATNVAALEKQEEANNKAVMIDEYTETLAMAGAASPPMTKRNVNRDKHERLLRSNANSEAAVQGAQNKVECPPGRSRDLLDFPQWSDEVGYWIGEYTLLQGDGTYSANPSWPYPYDSYKGFITGNIVGNSYRQRNVFLYPPAKECGGVVGEGVCGQNGNSLVFSADQTGCSTDGSIAGSFDIGGFPIETTTELIGADNALLYQVFIGGFMTQSQLTTINTSGDTTRRTRTAQSFAFGSGLPAGTSYYREVRVEKEEFYQQLEATISNYNILDSDLCVRDGFTRQPVADYMGGLEQCQKHLEQSFELV